MITQRAQAKRQSESPQEECLFVVASGYVWHVNNKVQRDNVVKAHRRPYLNAIAIWSAPKGKAPADMSAVYPDDERPQRVATFHDWLVVQ